MHSNASVARRHARPSRFTFTLLEVAFSLAFGSVVVHHVVTQDFKPLVAFCLPVLLGYYGFASLLYVRGRSLAEGPWQRRSLHAAERAMQAAVWHLVGIVLGVSVYGLLRSLDVGSEHTGLRLVLFAAPYALMQAGLLSFLRAAWVVAPQFTRRVSAFEVRRRVSAPKPSAPPAPRALPAAQATPRLRRVAITA